MGQKWTQCLAARVFTRAEPIGFARVKRPAFLYSEAVSAFLAHFAFLTKRPSKV